MFKLITIVCIAVGIWFFVEVFLGLVLRPKPLYIVAHTEAEITDYAAPEREAQQAEEIALEKRFAFLLGLPTPDTRHKEL